MRHVPRSFLLRGLHVLFSGPGTGSLPSNPFKFHFLKGGLPEIPGQSGSFMSCSHGHLWAFFIARTQLVPDQQGAPDQCYMDK